MAWPKGKPRKGYVKKDGTPAKRRGDRVEVIITNPVPKRYEQTKTEPKEGLVIKGMTGQPVIEPCPNCGYAYADGGACPECPWSRYDPSCPHCRKGA